jgi:cytochrome c553
MRSGDAVCPTIAANRSSRKDGMRSRWIAAALALIALPALAADIAAGRLKAATVCAACHGADGVSVSDRIPHLAGQVATNVLFLQRELAAAARR